MNPNPIDLLIRPEDLQGSAGLDAAGLCIKLRRPQSPLSNYLSGRLSIETQNLLTRFVRNAPISPELQTALTEDLNRVLQEGGLYDTARFAQITLSPRTRKLVAQAPQGEDLVRLNRMLLEESFPNQFVAAIIEIANRISREECNLFLGSAVHCAPPPKSPYAQGYADCYRLPIGSQLCEHLADRSSFAALVSDTETGNLQRVALHYESVRSRSELVDEIKSLVHVGKQPSPIVRALAKLGFPLVITTNYDRLFEQALSFTGTPSYDVSIYNPNEEAITRDYEPAPDAPTPDPTPQRPFIYKIHGDIECRESIVITDEDYIQFVLRMSTNDTDQEHRRYPIPLTALTCVKKWPTLFIGYSLMDYNLRLLFKTLRWKVDKANFPSTYSVDRSPDPLILDVWHNQRRYVKFVVQDVWEFVPELYLRVTGEVMPS